MFAEMVRRAALLADKKARRAARKARKAGILPEHAAPSEQGQLSNKQPSPSSSSKAVPATPVAFLFPGQGSQAVGMLQVHSPLCLTKSVWATPLCILSMSQTAMHAPVAQEGQSTPTL